MVSSVLSVLLNTLFGSAKSKGVSGIVANVTLRPLLIQQTLFSISHEKVTNGLHLLTVYSKATPFENRLKSSGLLGLRFFYWRHKLLSALKQMDFAQFEGIFEFDETYFLYFQKGQRGITERKPCKHGGKSKHRGISHEQVCVLVARDREKATVSKVSFMGRIVKSKVEKIIGSKLTSDNVLVTDARRAYKTYAKEKGLEHYQIKSDDGKH
jgi:hypothetical protein